MTRTLHIRVGSAEDYLLNIGADDTPPEDKVLSFEDLATFGQLFSAAKLELLQAIATHEPASIRETADLVGRDVKNVHGNLNDLAEFGLVTFEQEGRSKRPVVGFDEIEVTIPLVTHADEADTTEAIK